jgi:uncharacterized protein (DUF362 family)/Pyruvate/2-oxoacid:ferredoxin oxidoreductase delta subunit
VAKVVIKDCGDYRPDLIKSRIDAGMEPLGGWEKFVQSGMKVLLKVNLIGPKTSDSAAITHSEFVRAVIKILKERGCTVWIGDSSGGAIAGMAPTARSFDVSGLGKTAKEEGAVIKNFDREGVVQAETTADNTGKMYIAKPMFEADLVINLPKLKTHSAGIYTGAVKNLFGCIPGLKKAGYHRMAPNPKDLGLVIADIHRAVKVELNIMDGIDAMHGEGPTAGQVYHAEKILISTDPLALDVTAAAMLGLDITDIPILVSAREKGIGESDMKKIQIAGDYNTPPGLQGFRLPKRYKNFRRGNYTALVKLIDFLKTRPRINTGVCKHCDMCVESCPVGAINRETKMIDYNTCIECMCCHELCLHKAVELRKDNRFADVLIRLYRGKYR